MILYERCAKHGGDYAVGADDLEPSEWCYGCRDEEAGGPYAGTYRTLNEREAAREQDEYERMILSLATGRELQPARKFTLTAAIARDRDFALAQYPDPDTLPREIQRCACGALHNAQRFGQCVFCDGQTYNPRPAI